MPDSPMPDKYGGSDAGRPLTIVSMVQATTVTGPVKPLLLLSQAQQEPGFAGVRHRRTCLTTYRRRAGQDPVSAFERAARDSHLQVVSLPEAFPFDPRILPAIRRTLRQLQPDIVESHDCKSHLLAWILRATLSRRHRFEWVAFHHGYTRTSLRMDLYQQLDRLTLRHADAVVTLCQPFARELVSRGVSATRLQVISNFIDRRKRTPDEDCRALRTRVGIGANDLVLLSVGRLSPEKGHADLFEALGQLPERVGDRRVRLLLVGEGAERAMLESLAHSLGDRIIFAGFQPDTWPFYCLADVFVLPSHSEGSPLVVLEAMAAGLPIVATAVGGVPDLVENETSALLVPPRRPTDFAMALERMLSDDTTWRRIAAGAEARLEAFTVETYQARLQGIYDRVLAAQPGERVRPSGVH